MLVSKEAAPISGPHRQGPGEIERQHRPRRLVTGGRGYVGSHWGLGKPSYSGIGTRPDDGDAGD